MRRHHPGRRALAALLVAMALLPLAALRAHPAPVPGEIPVALLVDLASGQTLYAREAGRRFVPASVTKVMTAYTAFRLIEKGQLRLGQRFLYTPELEAAWYGEGSNMFLRAGQRPTIEQLLLGITTVSGNDASAALAEAAAGSMPAWLALMNREAARLGLRDTHFASANGYPDGGRTYTTARDLAVLGAALTEDFPGLYRRFFGQRSFTWDGRTQVNHDPVTGRVMGADGIKTGFTSEAGFTFLGSAARGERRLIMVLAGAPTATLRDEAARALLEWGFSQFRLQLLFPQGAQVGEARVQQGAARRVTLIAPQPIRASLPRHGAGQYRLVIRYRGPVTAPVARGQQIATLRLLHQGEVVMEAPLVAARAVERAGPIRRLVNGLAHWVEQ